MPVSNAQPYLRFFSACTVSPGIKWPCYGFKSLMYKGYHIFHVNDPVHTQKDAVKALRAPSRRAGHKQMVNISRCFYLHTCLVVCCT